MAMRRPERNLEIQRRHEAGESPAMIAEAMALSRNVVAGVLDRDKHRKERERQPIKPDFVLAPPEPEPEPEPEAVIAPAEALPGVHLLDAENHHCRWVIAPLRYCGEPKVAGRSFCYDHTLIAFTQYVRHNR